jgi:hypothetical protein
MSPERSSSIPPEKDYRYSFEEARIYMPEEQKDFAVRMVPILRERKNDFENIVGDEEDEGALITDFPESVFRMMEATLENLAKPVEKNVFDEVNKHGKTAPITWNQIRKLYGVEEIKLAIALMNALRRVPRVGTAKHLINILSRLIKSLDEVIEARGGDSGLRLDEINERYRISKHSKWHDKLFSERERECYVMILNILSERFGESPSGLVIKDYGCGEGRCFSHLRTLFEQGFSGSSTSFSKAANFPLHSQEELEKMASNYHAIDKSGENIRITRELVKSVMKEQPFNSANINEGNFHNPHIPSACGVEPGTVHFGLSMMRTGFHNINERQTVSYLRMFERDLRPGNTERAGGIGLMDSVDMMRIEPDLRGGIEVEASLDDLKNLYPQINRKYNEDSKNLPFPKEIDLNDMPRHAIYDNTTGQGFYWREVLTQDYVEYLIKKYKLDLKVSGSISAMSNKRQEMKYNPECREATIALGREWIEKNNLDDYYRKTLHDRLERGIIDPKILKETGYSGNIEVLMDYLAYNMVRGFRSVYLILERPQIEI